MADFRSACARLAGALGVALALTAAPAALAAPCSGFTDVEDTSAFCPNVDWLKNRAITLGCTSATLYCPNDPVSRLAMAAFMNRLGTALTPVELKVDAAPGAVDLDAASVVCQSSEFVVSGFPRRVFAEATTAVTAAADVNLAADLAMSVNGGPFVNMNTLANRGSAAANQWGGLSDIGTVDLTVGQAVRFGVRLSRGGVPGTAQLTGSTCQLRALVFSRDGMAAPF